MNSFCGQSFMRVTQNTVHHKQSSLGHLRPVCCHLLTSPHTTHSHEPGFALYPSRSAARRWGRGEGNKIASQVVRALRWDGRRGGGHLTAWICCFHSISLSTQARGERMSCRLDLAPWYRTCSMFVARWPAWARCPRWRSNTKLFVTLGRIFLSRVSRLSSGRLAIIPSRARVRMHHASSPHTPQRRRPTLRPPNRTQSHIRERCAPPPIRA